MACSAARWCSSAAPGIEAALRRAEHRGRRLGRAPVRGRRVGHRLGLPGRRAQRLDRGHRDEMPGAGEERAPCGATPPAREDFAAGWASTCSCATSSTANGISSAPTAGDARRGACGAAGAGESGGYYLRDPGEADYRMMHGSHRPVPKDSDVIVRTGGGGGWGDPLERDPRARALGRGRGVRVEGSGARGVRRGARRGSLGRRRPPSAEENA